MRRLGSRVHTDERVVVLYGGMLLKGRVSRSRGSLFHYVARMNDMPRFGVQGVKDLCDEGITWAHGWDTDAAKAMFVAAALSNDTRGASLDRPR